MPLLRERFAGFGAAELARCSRRNGLPYAPITQPEELFDDPHLRPPAAWRHSRCRPTPAPAQTRAHRCCR